MRRVLLLLSSLALGASASSSNSRRVNFYFGAGDIEGNAYFASTHRASMTGVYLCCGGGDFLANGSFVSPPTEEVNQQTAALRALGLELYIVIGIQNTSVASGSWTAGIADAVSAAVAARVDGYVVDYEPATNYTVEHAQAYANFLDTLGTAMHAANNFANKSTSLQLAFDTAGWGILDFWNVYAPLANRSGSPPPSLDFVTSMTPTYFGNNITLNQEFIVKQITQGGMPAEKVGIGIGSMLTPDAKPPAEWNYNWTSEKLSSFVNWCGTPGGEGGGGIGRVDVWRADIDHQGNFTEPYYFQVLADFLAAGR